MHESQRPLFLSLFRKCLKWKIQQIKIILEKNTQKPIITIPNDAETLEDVQETNALETGDPDLAFDIYKFYPAKGNV